MEPTVPFDRVVLTEDEGSRELTLPQFLALPLPLRIRSIVGRRLEFFRQGQPVDRAEALRSLSVSAGSAA